MSRLPGQMRGRDGVHDPGMVDAVDADHVRGAGSSPASTSATSLSETASRPSSARARSRSAASRSTSTRSGVETISMIVKCPRRIVIWESSMFPSCSSSTSETRGHDAGPVAPDRGHGEVAHRSRIGSRPDEHVTRADRTGTPQEPGRGRRGHRRGRALRSQGRSGTRESTATLRTTTARRCCASSTGTRASCWAPRRPTGPGDAAGGRVRCASVPSHAGAHAPRRARLCR